MVEKEDEAFVEEYLNAADPSILHFLLASGEEVRGRGGGGAVLWGRRRRGLGRGSRPLPTSSPVLL